MNISVHLLFGDYFRIYVTDLRGIVYDSKLNCPQPARNLPSPA